MSHCNSTIKQRLMLQHYSKWGRQDQLGRLLQQHQLTIRTSAQAAKTLKTLQNFHSRSSREGKAANKSKKPQNGLLFASFLQKLRKKVVKTLNISVKIRLKKSQGSLFFESCSFHQVLQLSVMLTSGEEERMRKYNNPFFMLALLF